MPGSAHFCRQEVVALCDLLVKLLHVRESGNDARWAALGLLTMERKLWPCPLLLLLLLLLLVLMLMLVFRRFLKLTMFFDRT